jgi:hypothetical protein
MIFNIFLCGNCITRGPLITKEKIFNLNYKNLTYEEIDRLFGKNKEERKVIIDNNEYKIFLNKTKYEDVISIFGKPNGYFLIPTSFKIMETPQNAKKIFLYMNIKYKSLFLLESKFLILFFDDNNLVIRKIYEKREANIIRSIF